MAKSAKPAADKTPRPAKAVTKAEPAKPKGNGQSAVARRAGFIEVLRRTANVSRAAREAGMSTTTAYRERKTVASFSAQWDAALAEALDAIEEAVIGRVRDGVKKPVFFGGKVVGAVQNYSDQLSMFILRSKRPEIYNRPAGPTGGAFSDPDTLTEADAEAEFDRRMARLKAR